MNEIIVVYSGHRDDIGFSNLSLKYLSGLFDLALTYNQF